MIADLDETIRQLLMKELPVKNGEIDIKFDQPKREWSARLSKPTVNLFLYDVRENNVLRQHHWEHVREGNGTVTQKRSPMRVDCFYMLTTWASDPEDEHRLLTRCLLALFRFPILPEDRLEGTLRNPPFEIQARLAAHDRLTNPAELWSALDNELRPSVSYVVSLALDPWTEITGPAVRSYTFKAGQAYRPEREQSLQAGGEAVPLVTFGGTVRKKSADQEPLSGIQVAVKGTGQFSTSDEQGRYRLGGLPPGDYTVIVWPPTGKPVEKSVTLPARDGDYEILV
jgi:hypothetical protein